MGVYLRARFEVSSIILTSFRQGGDFIPPPSPTPLQNEPLKHPPRLGLRHLFQAVCGSLMKLLVIKNVSRTLTLYFAMP